MPKIIVSQIVQYGTMADWQWLIETYSKQEVHTIIQGLPRATLREKLQPLVQAVFSV
jgi:hypothetical protein